MRSKTVMQQCSKCGKTFPVTYLEGGDFEKGADACDCRAYFWPVGEEQTLDEWQSHETAIKYQYQMLSRLKTDCIYFLGFGNGCEKHLWAGNVKDHLDAMRHLYETVPEKPSWLTLKDIDELEQKMMQMKKK